MGVDIDEKDYHLTIIALLPTFLSNFASGQLTAAQLYSPTKTIEPDALISIISEEFDCQKSQHACWSGAKGQRDGDNKALAFVPGQKKKGDSTKSNARKDKRTCWNCREEDHLQCNCPKPKKEQGAPSSSKAKGAANAAMGQDLDSDVAFGIEESWDSDSMPDLASASNSDLDSDSMPSLMTISNSSFPDSKNDDKNCDDGADLFSDMGDDVDEATEGEEVNWSKVSSFVEGTSALPNAESWDLLQDALNVTLDINEVGENASKDFSHNAP